MKLAAIGATFLAVGAYAIQASGGESAYTVTVARDVKVDGKGVRWWAKRARENGAGMRWQRKRADGLERRSRPEWKASAAEAISYVFGPYAGQALRVAYCESRYSVYASNGQYLGLFQMGEFARGRYGHGWSAWAQAISAYRYFADAGYSWGPWACKP